MTESNVQHGRTGKVVLGMTISLDGFISDRNGDLQSLYPDLEVLRKTEELQASITATGAVVMGRRAYDMTEGDFTNYEFQVPIFVLSRTIRQNSTKGENENMTFTFVGEGIETAIERAKVAAGDKCVTVIGGANTAQQVLRAGLADELRIDIAPILLGEGLRLFEHIWGCGNQTGENSSRRLSRSSTPRVPGRKARWIKGDDDGGGHDRRSRGRDRSAIQ